MPRPALVDRMLARESASVFALVAPPGYGKTTLLAEWASKQGRDVAWVSLDEGDNDPSALLAATAMALGRVQPVHAGIFEALSARTMAIPTAIAALTSTFTSTTAMTFVMDNVESVVNRASLGIIAELACRLPHDSRFAYASRSPLPLPKSLQRSPGAIMEIGRDDLTMDRREAELVLTAAGATLSPDELDDVYQQTEGWPVALYLAGVASQSRRPPRDGFVFRGDDVLMGDYLRAQVLSRLPAATVSFLTRTSTLDQMSGPLCDALLDTRGSQTMFERLDSSNLLLVPLDRQRSWYRYHWLFRDVLRAELERREPALVPVLHGRAARWLEEHRMPEPAIRHAQGSGDQDLVVRLVTAATQPAYAAGRVAEVRSWLEWFRTEGLIDQHPHVAVMGALVEAHSGRTASTERWTAAAEAAGVGNVAGAEADDDEFTGSLACLRSVLCRQGPAQMRADAQLSCATLGAEHPLRAGALLFEALSHLLDGAPDVADPLLAHAYAVAIYLQATPAAAAVAAFQAMVALRRDDWLDAQLLARRGLSLVENAHLQDYMEAAAVYAVAARSAIHSGDVPTARLHLAKSARIRPLLTYAVPASALIQLEIAHAYLQISDTDGARAALREVRDILNQRPDLGIVKREADDLHRSVDAIRQGPVGASSLTAAELRLLPLLATHLSFPEIGARLHVSRHTVKTQAISVYRKFGVSSRSDAIQCAEAVGLLGH